MDEKPKRLTAEPNTPEFWRQMLNIAKGSKHPMDVALVPTLERKLAEAEEGDDGT